MWLPRGESCGGWMDWESGIRRYKLLCIEWMNKVILYSSRNYIQYPVITYNGKNNIIIINLFYNEYLLCDSQALF